MTHPLKDGPSNEHWRTLPEICMVLHMEHTGSADVLTREQYTEAVRYIDGRVEHWKPTRNGRSSYLFDQQVLGMCIVVLDEAKNYAKRFGPAEIKA